MSQPVSLVLGGGGARGLAHIGVIEELEKADFSIQAISGCSMGSVIGGIYASGNLEKYKKWMLNLDKLDVFGLMDFTLSSQGFIKGDKIFHRIKQLIGDRNIEDLPIPFVAVATDILNRREIVFAEGSLFQAMRASTAIPTVVQPSRTNGLLLVDGAVLNPLPIVHVHRSAGDLLVVVDVSSPNGEDFPNKKEVVHSGNWQDLILKKDAPREKLGYFNLLNRVFELMEEKLAVFILEKHQPDILVSISKDACHAFEFYRAAEMIKLGKRAFHKALTGYHKAKGT